LLSFYDKIKSVQFSDVKFPQDSGHQKLLKSVHFLPNYSKYKSGRFLTHSVDNYTFIRNECNTKIED